jgi:Domain of unknown function (DUF6458)
MDGEVRIPSSRRLDMGIGVSLILIAVGAVLTWAVTDNVSNVDLSNDGPDRVVER